MSTNDDRAEFAERIRRQVAARYRDTEVIVDAETFSLRVSVPGHDISVPLTPLFRQAERTPEKTGSLIGKFVGDIESKLSPEVRATFSLAIPLWCVRSQKYLTTVGRASELLTRPVAGDLVAFVAQMAPNNAMRGIPESEWRDAGIGDIDVERAATKNTRERFDRVLARLNEIERVPADGWRIAVDELFCASILLIPEVLETLVAKAGGDVLIANPDRSYVLAIPHDAAGADVFRRRVTREWREAMNPTSKVVLRTDGMSLRVEEPVRSTGLVSWLRN